MSPFLLLAGIAVAAGVFAGFLWSAYQSYAARGPLRWAHLGLVLLTLAGMAALEAEAPLAARIAGALMILAALAGMVLERRWNRALPFLQFLFALALAAALPFAGP